MQALLVILTTRLGLGLHRFFQQLHKTFRVSLCFCGWPAEFRIQLAIAAVENSMGHRRLGTLKLLLWLARQHHLVVYALVNGRRRRVALLRLYEGVLTELGKDDARGAFLLHLVNRTV